MATDGVDSQAGTAAAPVATLAQALRLAENQPEPADIVVRGGTYFLEETVDIPRSGKDSRLLIRSADNETAVFDGSVPIERAEPMPDAPGVYACSGDFPSDEPPPVWEESTGTHFVKLAGLGAVRHKDCSVTVLNPQTLALRCRDGAAPAGADIRMSRSGVRYGFRILRDNVTVHGIAFRNFCLTRNAGAILVGDFGVGARVEDGTVHRDGVLTRHTVLDACVAVNGYAGFVVCGGSADTVITRCRVQNTITGLYSSGADVTVEECRFVNDPDWLGEKRKGADEFETTGIFLYAYCTRHTIRNTLIKGFPNGIFSKNCWGRFVIEHNTLLGQAHVQRSGFAIRPQMSKDYQVRYNVFAGFFQPFADFNSIPPDADVDYNVFWGPETNPANYLKMLQERGVGRYNLVAAPRFAAPHRDDYRLLPGSPALGIHGQKNAGAYPPVPADYRGAPNLRVTLSERKGMQTRAPAPPPGLSPFSCYTSTQRQVAASLDVSATAPVVRTRVAINDGPETERDFAASDSFDLPDRDGWHALRCRVRDEHGAWSQVRVVHVHLRRAGLRLLDEPRVLTNRYGALVFFAAGRDAWGTLEYRDGDDWTLAATSADLVRHGRYGLSALPLPATGLPSGKPQRYRLTVATALDTLVKEGVFTLAGAPRIMYVGTDGEDAEDGGARDRPFRTIQFALDRALPGDRVRILPGVYFGPHVLNHGGTAAQPLIVEGLYPNTVILDGLMETGTALRLDHAPHVILRNLNLRWVKTTAISVAASAGVRVTGCRFHNQYWQTASWPRGTGVAFANSPGFMVDHCIFSRFFVAGKVFDGSPEGKILHNTATACAVSLFQWRRGKDANDDLTIMYNSLHWNSNQLLQIQQPRETLRRRCRIDYNNYGTTFQQQEGTPRDHWGTYGKSLPRPFPYLPRNRELHYYRDTTEISNPITRVFVNLEDWQAFSGQDTHSFGADPKWIDPKAGRFDVAADSPNLLPDGKVIGALGCLGKTPNMVPEVVVTSPHSGEEVGHTLTVTAEASDYDGTVTAVEFYAGATRLGRVLAPPYTLAGLQLPAGSHQLTVRAFDNRGGMGVTDPVQIRVTRE